MSNNLKANPPSQGGGFSLIIKANVQAKSGNFSIKLEKKFLCQENSVFSYIQSSFTFYLQYIT
jgi:hypothetical protein